MPAPARGLFVPGNHDWEKGGARGFSSIKAQQALVETHSDGNRITISPVEGCPGPVAIANLNERLLVVALDTQWWLHDHEKAVRRPLSLSFWLR